MIPQGIKDWAHTDPHTALRVGNPSPPQDNTGLQCIGMMGAGKALGTGPGQALMRAPLVKPLVTAMDRKYGGKSGVSATLGLSLLPNGRILRQLDDRQD